jgi:type II secretory pathway pseudopilin PulG
VLAIVGVLLGGLMYTLLAQLDQRSWTDTEQRLDSAREALLGFATVNGRLPCPAREDSFADEVRSATGECRDGTGEIYYGGLLPARAIGLQPVDAQGYAIDAWGNRLRYAVAKTVTGCAATSPALPHFTHAANLKSNGITCQPADLLVCRSSSGISGTSCGAAGNVVTNQNVVVAIVWSQGKNAIGAGADETANLNGDAVFVSRLPAPAGAAGGAFDDLMVWLPAGLLYGRLIAAGVLP